MCLALMHIIVYLSISNKIKYILYSVHTTASEVYYSRMAHVLLLPIKFVMHWIRNVYAICVRASKSQ